MYLRYLDPPCRLLTAANLQHQSTPIIYAAPLYCRPSRPTRQPHGAYVSAKAQATRFHHFHTPNSKLTMTIDLLAVSRPATCLIAAPCLSHPRPVSSITLLPCHAAAGAESV